MSAGAIAVTKNKIHLYSDGLGITRKGESSESTGYNYNKIKPISERVSLLVLGIWNQHLEEKIKEVTRFKSEPKEIAESISSALISEFKDTPELQSLFAKGDMRSIQFVAGFDQQAAPHVYWIDSHPKYNFQPVDVGKGNSFFGIGLAQGDGGNNIFPDLFYSNYKKLKNANIAGAKAFRTMVQTYREQGETVGGELFYKQINPLTVSTN